METTGCVSNNETEFLAVQSSPRSARDAATQTPQMMRHPSPTGRQQVHYPPKGSSSSEESLVYEDSNAYPSSISNGATPIPVVIIEYNEDTLPLTKDMLVSNSAEQQSGITNLAFESKGEMIRCSPTSGFGQQTDSFHPNSPVFLQPNQHLIFNGNSSDSLGSATVGASRRVYYSLPRTSRKKQEKDLMIRSQPPTPQMNRTKDAGVDTNQTFWIIPRDDSINSLNTIPPSSAKYVTPDSVNGLYTISGGPGVVPNGYPDPVIGLYEMHLVPPVPTPAQSTPKSVRKFEFTKMPASVDRKRRRLQCCTDGFSLFLFFPGILIAAATPALVAPLFYVTPTLFPMYIIIFLASGTLSTVFLAFSGIVGNIVWYYDENSKKLRPRLHCGKGPTFHFWGNAFYNTGNKEKEKEVIV